jgi:hypothetical protein
MHGVTSIQGAIVRGKKLANLNIDLSKKIFPGKRCSQDKLKMTGGMEMVNPSPCD